MLYCLLQCGHFLNTCWMQVGSDIFRPNLEHKWIVTSEQPPQETLHCHDRLLFYFFLSPAAAVQTAGWLLPNLYITYYNTKKDAQIGIGPDHQRSGQTAGLQQKYLDPSGWVFCFKCRGVDRGNPRVIGAPRYYTTPPIFTIAPSSRTGTLSILFQTIRPAPCGYWYSWIHSYPRKLWGKPRGKPRGQSMGQPIEGKNLPRRQSARDTGWKSDAPTGSKFLPRSKIFSYAIRAMHR